MRVLPVDGAGARMGPGRLGTAGRIAALACAGRLAQPGVRSQGTETCVVQLVHQLLTRDDPLPPAHETRYAGINRRGLGFWGAGGWDRADGATTESRDCHHDENDPTRTHLLHPKRCCGTDTARSGWCEGHIYQAIRTPYSQSTVRIPPFLPPASFSRRLHPWPRWGTRVTRT